MAASEWAADVPISMPLPSEDPTLVPMFGFGFTEFCLVHDLNDTDFEEMIQPDFAPMWHHVAPTRYYN
jgi:hypothetical protein